MSGLESTTNDIPIPNSAEDVISFEGSCSGDGQAPVSQQDVEDIIEVPHGREGHTDEPTAFVPEYSRTSTLSQSGTALSPDVDDGSSIISRNLGFERRSDVTDRVESVTDFLNAVPSPMDAASQAHGLTALTSMPPVDQGEASLVPDSDNAVASSISANRSPATRREEGHGQNGDLRYSTQRTRANTVGGSNIGFASQETAPSPDSRRNAMYLREGLSSLPSSIPPLSRARASRQGREIQLPRWQPDAEATYCPICNTQFSFFVRKHHCRKCGRVVCASCSPHRITIPYQFIVQDIASQGSDRRLETTDNQGGMKVRLCNPCVPDPNILPPTPLGPPPSYYIATGDRGVSITEEALSHLESQGNRMFTNPSLPNNHSQNTMAPGAVEVGARSSQRSSLRGTTTGALGSSVPSSRTLLRTEEPQWLARHSATNDSQRRGHSSRHQSLTVMGSLRLSHHTTDRNRPLPPVPRIPEEDECPICHGELPPRSLPDFETARETHIVQCIDQQINAHQNLPTRPGAYTSNSQPPATLLESTTQPLPSSSTMQTAAAATTSNPVRPSNTTAIPATLLPQNLRYAIPGSASSSSQSAIPNTPEARMAAREQAHAAVVLGHNRSPSGSESIRRTAMFPYKATEKDCVDEAECTICLEEFEVGVAMARLECLCRFHRSCIQDWFVSHPGMCPVHQHDGYGF